MRPHRLFRRLLQAWAALAAVAVLAVPWLPRQALYACTTTGQASTVCCCGLWQPIRSGCCDVISVAATAQPAPAAMAPAAPAPILLPPIALLEWPPTAPAASQIDQPVARGPPPRAVPVYLVWSVIRT
jgi:hypothetical protein